MINAPEEELVDLKEKYVCGEDLSPAQIRTVLQSMEGKSFCNGMIFALLLGSWITVLVAVMMFFK
jgi:hypothetical protein